MNKVVGIRSIGRYIPKSVRTSEDISKASGIDEYVIREKFGIKQVNKATDESVYYMAKEAVLDALGDIDPLSIDLLVYCGSEFKDYYLFNCAAKIQDEAGLKNAQTFELHSLCSAGVYSLKVIKSMMLCDENINRAIIVSSSRESDLINFKDHTSRFMFNFGDGAGAVLLEKDYNKNLILETHMISDGRFASDVKVKRIGAKNFKRFNELKDEDLYLSVEDIQKMKEGLDPITEKNFISVIEESVRKSGYKSSDIDFIAPIFMKRSILVHMLEYFNLTEENSFVLENYGHCQSADSYFSLYEGMKAGRLKDGDLAVLVGAGTGYTWAATTVRWG